MMIMNNKFMYACVFGFYLVQIESDSVVISLVVCVTLRGAYVQIAYIAVMT